MQLRIKPEVSLIYNKVDSFLASRDIQAYLVGGFVRDSLLDIESADIDIAISRDTLEVIPHLAEALGGKYVLLDQTNRVARIILSGETQAGSAQPNIDFSSFRDDIKQDLGRRDFTIDAMAVSLSELLKNSEHVQLIDPFGGLKDLQNRLIRAVGDEVFEQDSSRLLRAVRLAAELNFTIDQATETLIRQNAHLTRSVAGERTREEMVRLLSLSQAGYFFFYLDELGILTSLIPELSEAKGVEQPKEHHWNVFEHSLKTIDATSFLLRDGTWQYARSETLAAVPWSERLAHYFNHEVSSGTTRKSLLRLAALLHDISKPETKSIESDGRIRFLGHALVGSEKAAGILKRLRFSSKETEMVKLIVEHHLRPGQLSQEGMPSNRAIYRYFRDLGEAAIGTLFFSLADHLATRGPNLIPDHWQRHAHVVEYVLTKHFEEEKITSPPKLVSGDDVISTFGISPGPKIGKILEFVREAQASGEILSREEALAYIHDYLLSKIS